MRAARFGSYGPPEVLSVDEVPRPVPGPDDVLVAVHAASVNPIDTKIRRGGQRGVIRLKLPWITGLDVSGVVVEVGARVTRFRAGDAVFGSPSHRRPGTMAEYVAVAAGELAAKPASVSHVEAASLPLVALTAWEALVRLAGLGAGETVLIQAGAGGVGTVAIQLARHLGARVVTTCSAGNAALVRELGAERVIDYRSERWDEAVSGLDVVLDALGGEEKARALGVLRRGGRLVSLNSDLPACSARYGPHLGVLVAVARMAAIGARGRLGHGVRVRHALRPSDGAVLGEIGALVDAGVIRPVIDRVLPLDAIAEAHRYVESGRARGKVVVAIRGEGA